ncbi:MAG: helix-turn-helix domain-containing protein [Bacteroidetes bacterium]|nr:helix-turn-helix domain-containing protein [Bacteroidota bacterium]
MKHVSIIIPQGEPILSCITLAYEVLVRANQYHQGPKLKVEIVGKRSRSHEGLFSVQPHKHYKDVDKTDLIIIPAIQKNFDGVLKENKALIEWVRDQHLAGAEIASLCTGAFLLASTGLLQGRQCSTHWQAANAFRQLFPTVDLATEKLITDNHGLYTTGGAISSMNLVLYLIEKNFDRETAIYVAKVFEIDINRSSQSPFIIFVGQKNHEDDQIRKAQLFMENNVGEKILVSELADKFAIGRRHFDRRFIKATGNTPAEYLQRIKVEAAKKDLETTQKNIHEVMYDIGYSDIKAFREVFRKYTGLSPLDYRNRYNKETAVVF